MNSAPVVDLHCHSTRSDGALTPEALVAAAAAAGVEVLAITDHDTTAALPAARAAASRRGMRLIDGVEISCTWNRRTIHVVGLGIDSEHAALSAGLGELQRRRDERARRIGERLARMGLEDAYSKAREMAGNGQITRTHFARLMVREGLVKDLKTAFKRALGAGKSAHVSIEWASLAEAVSWIHAAGGQAVLAHPHSYRLTRTTRLHLLEAFSAAGGDALEVCCGNSTRDDLELATRDALRFNLKGSVGSDFHSPDQRWLGLGRLQPLPAGIEPVWA